MIFNEIYDGLYKPEPGVIDESLVKSLTELLSYENLQPHTSYPEIFPYEAGVRFVVKNTVGNPNRFVGAVISVAEGGVSCRMFASQGVSNSVISDSIVRIKREKQWITIACVAGFIALHMSPDDNSYNEIHLFLSESDLNKFRLLDDAGRDKLLEEFEKERKMDPKELKALKTAAIMQEYFSDSMSYASGSFGFECKLSDDTQMLCTRYESENKIIHYVIMYDEEKGLQVTPYFAGSYSDDELKAANRPMLFEEGMEISGSVVSSNGICAGYFALSWKFDKGFYDVKVHDNLLSLLCEILPGFVESVEKALSSYSDKRRGMFDLNEGLSLQMKKHARNMARKVTEENALSFSEYGEIFGVGGGNV